MSRPEAATSEAQGKSLADTLLWLCSVPSPIGEEAELCAALEERVRRWQGPAPVVRVLNSLVVPVVRGAPSPTGERRYHVALVGHLDTVRTENGPARLEGRRCFGAGASDMKSGLAVMLVLVERLAQEGRLASLPVDLTLVFYSREEGPFAENELGPVLEQVPWLSNVDLAVCLEPSDNKLSLGCNGSLHATVTFQGRTAHSARPWEGDNAIYRAAEFLGRMAKLEPKPTVLDGLTYRTVTTVTQAKDGGRGRNVVPDRFVLNLNHRFAPGTSVEDAEKDVLALVGPHATVEITDRSPPAPPSLAHPLVRGLVASGVRAVEPKQAWTDVGRFHAHGVAAVNFGPGENAQAHQKNESTDLELVDEGYAILRRWLQEPLGNGSS